MATTYKVIGQQATAQESFSITNKVLTNNVATLTTSANHNLVVGQSVSIIMTTPDEAFDGVRVVTSAPTETTFTFGSVNSNVSTVAATGTGTGFTWYTLYTCPENTSAVLSSLVVTNRGSSGGYYQIAVSDSSTTVSNKDFIVMNDLAAGNETIGLSLGVTLDSTVKYLRVSASNANFTFNAFGMEMTP